MKIATAISIFLFSLISAADARLSILDLGQNCVAYKTQKKYALVRTVDVVGKACDITTQVVPELGGKYLFKVEVPIAKFESGESERDRDVKKILKESVQENLVFTSEQYTKTEWKTFFDSKKAFNLKGRLSIGGKEYIVSALAKLEKGLKGYEVDGLIKSDFKHFEIEAPKLFAGLMAQVQNDLELHFHFLADKTLGIYSILDIDDNIK